MAVDPISIGSTVLGGAGLFNQKRQQSEARKYQNQAADALGEERDFRNRIRKIAMDYDPSKETEAAVDYASKVTGDTLTKGLLDTNARFKAAGGDPTGDTRFNVSTQGLTNRITDPLRAFVANRKGNEFAQRLNAFQVALSAPVGQFADTYSRLSQMATPDLSGTMNLISSGIRGLMPGKSAAPGASPLATGSDQASDGGQSVVKKGVPNFSPEQLQSLLELAKSIRGFA